MEKRKSMKRWVAYLLTLCMLISGFSTFGIGTVQAAGTITVYFYNSGNWSTVGAHAYVNNTSVTGDWGSTTAQTATELGSKWMKVTVPVDTAFNIIFFDKDGDQENNRIDVYVGDASHVYATMQSNDAYDSQRAAEEALGISSGDNGSATNPNGKVTVYFYNNLNWKDVYVYAYDANKNEYLGKWGGTRAQSDGDKWYKTTIETDVLPSIIFHDNADNRIDTAVQDTENVYFTGNGAVYNSKKLAEIASGTGNTSDNSTTVYFKNSKGWEKIYGYVYKNGQPFGTPWPGVIAEKATEKGESWWKIVVPMKATSNDSFNVIFTDTMSKSKDVSINNQQNVYITPAGEVFSSVEAADEATKNDTVSDVGGVNEDVENYGMELSGAGANLPYTTYEAEVANTNAKVLEKSIRYVTDIQSEASGRQAVQLEKSGDYVEFTLTEPANAFVLRYNMPDSSDGTGINESLSVYADGQELNDLSLTSKYAWIYGSYPYENNPSKGSPHRFFDETRAFFGKTLPAGTKVKLQKNDEDKAESYIIDFIECELVGDSAVQPENSLSIVEYGAVADDGKDDAKAIRDCITAAKQAGKEVWIPAGTFNLPDKAAFEVSDVVIRGAGMWHSKLEGMGAAFKYSGTCKFYDFAMTSDVTIRNDAEDLAGFEGLGEAVNVTIQNIWMEHMKVGVWSYNTTNLVIQGCRIRNTYADGINLCSKSNNAVVRNNSLRNTGDDCIAIWPWKYDSNNNTIAYNTVQMPTLANGIAFYGGAGNKILNNYVADIIDNGSGICLGTDYETPNGFTGTTTVEGNVLLRCGSYQHDYQYDIGAIWIWATNKPMQATYNIQNNNLYDCSYEAFLIDSYAAVSGVTFKDINVYGANTNGINVKGTANGNVKLENVAVANFDGDLVANEVSNLVTIEKPGKGIYREDSLVAADSLTLNKSEFELAEGNNTTLIASVNPDNASNKNIVWMTSNRNVATVEDGMVTAMKPGMAIITAKVDGGIKIAKCYITVVAKTADEGDDSSAGGTTGTGDEDNNTGNGGTTDTGDEDNNTGNGGTTDTEEDDNNTGENDNNNIVEDDQNNTGGDVNVTIPDDEDDTTSDSGEDGTESDKDNNVDSDTGENGSDGENATNPDKDGNDADGENAMNPDKDSNGSGGENATNPDKNGDDSSGENTVNPDKDGNGSGGGNATNPDKDGTGSGGEDTTNPDDNGNGSDGDHMTNPDEDGNGSGGENTTNPGGNSSGDSTNNPGDGTSDITNPGDNTGNNSTGDDMTNSDNTGNNAGENGATNSNGNTGSSVIVDGTTNSGENVGNNTGASGTTNSGGNVSTSGGTNTNNNSNNVGGNSIVNQDNKVTEIKLTGISQKIAAGKKIQLNAKVSPANATNQKIEWKSNDERYATVDADGLVTIKKTGAGKTVRIIATAADGSGTIAIYKIKIMKHAVKKIVINGAKVQSVKAGNSVKLRTSVVTTGKSVNKKVQWNSSNTKYATVSNSGRVTTKKAGSGKMVTITARSTDGSGRKATVKIRIN